MDLDQKYELGEAVANDSESKSFRAREIATGRAVFVHILFGGKAPGARESLLNMLLQRAVDPVVERRKQILEISDHKGMPYAVTEVFPGFQNLRAWLDQTAEPPPSASQPRDLTRAGRWKVPTGVRPEQAPVMPSPPQPVPDADDEFARLFRTEQPASPPSQAPVRPSPPPRDPGEFTRLFRATVGDRPPVPPSPVDVPAPPPSGVHGPPVPPAPPTRAPEPPSPPPSDQPGEFTRLFQPVTGTSVPTTPGSLSGTGSALPEPPHQTQQPGEFTRLFQTSAGTPPSSVPMSQQPPPAGSAPGEFTRLFQSAGPGPAEPSFGQPPASATPFEMPSQAPAPPSPPAGGPGEFTRLFGSPMAGGAPPPVPSAPPPPASSQARRATGVFSVNPPAPAQPEAASSSGPGEYTRMFGSAPVAGGAGAPPPPPAAAPPQQFQVPGVPLQPPAMPQVPQMQMPQTPQMQMPQAPQVPPMQMQMPQMAAPPVATGLPRPAASNLLLIVIICFMFVLIAAVILYFLLKK